MIKLFHQNGKVNFVDEANTFIGYDLAQDCCEYASWFVSKNAECSNIADKELEDETQFPLHGYSIAKTCTHVHFTDLDAGDAVRFTLIPEHRDKPTLYLYLFNCHNGYYAHSFEFGSMVLIESSWL